VSQQIRVCNESPCQDDLLVLKELIESGRITPVVGTRYPLSRTPDALRHFGEGPARGKVVIIV
jgi:NADPH:quinone reductase-like Zn-dependent oxidoreductase